MTGIDHERGIDRSHCTTADNCNFRHLTLRASGPTAATSGNQPQRIGVDTVFDLKDPRRQHVRRIVIANRDRTLHQNRASVGFRNDEMDGRAGYFHACFQGLAMRIEAGKRRQQ